MNWTMHEIIKQFSWISSFMVLIIFWICEKWCTFLSHNVQVPVFSLFLRPFSDSTGHSLLILQVLSKCAMCCSWISHAWTMNVCWLGMLLNQICYFQTIYQYRHAQICNLYLFLLKYINNTCNIHVLYHTNYCMHFSIHWHRHMTLNKNINRYSITVKYKLNLTNGLNINGQSTTCFNFNWFKYL